MKLRTKLTIAFLGCGLLPLLVAGTISYRTAHQGMNRLEKEAETALKNGLVEKLNLIRDSKKQQVVTYFDVISKLVINFSSAPATVQAMADIKKAFVNYREEAKITNIPQMRQELMQYYASDFGNEYRKQTNRPADFASYVGRLDDDAVALQHAYIRMNTNPLGQKHLMNRSEVDTTYNKQHQQIHSFVREYLDQFSLYDVFLIDSETGKVVYSVFKEIDYGTSLKDGPLSKSSLAEVFRRLNDNPDKNAFGVVDFQPYFPSYDAPACFIASPIFDGDKRLGMCVFQVPLNRISEIMMVRTGLGETGDSYLFGSDYLPRSDVFLDQVNRTVVAAFRNPTNGRVDWEGPKKAIMKGESGCEQMIDCRGKNVFSAYCPMEVAGLKWGLIAKQDISEAFASVDQMSNTAEEAGSSLLWWVGGIVLASTLGVTAIGIWNATAIARPIATAADYAGQIASGDLTSDCTVQATGEVGDLIGAMNGMRTSLVEMVTKLNQNASTLSRSSGDLSATAVQLSGGAEQTTELSTSVTAAAEEMSASMSTVSSSTEEMSANVRTVAAAIEEMTASIGEVAKNAERAAGVAQQAAELTETSSAKIGQLGSAASEIGKVIEVIQDIAEQTNLLALNATIEAARAGDAGKGFAVVATEVKELAKQTASATDDIRQRIQAIQAATTEAIGAIGEIESVIRNVNDVSRTIASAVEEQRITTTEISKSVNETTTAVDNVSKSIQETAMASREITENMTKVDVAARQTSTGAGQAKEAGDELLSLAEELQQLVQHFRTEEVA